MHLLKDLRWGILRKITVAKAYVKIIINTRERQTDNTERWLGLGKKLIRTQEEGMGIYSYISLRVRDPLLGKSCSQALWVPYRKQDMWCRARSGWSKSTSPGGETWYLEASWRFTDNALSGLPVSILERGTVAEGLSSPLWASWKWQVITSPSTISDQQMKDTHTIDHFLSALLALCWALLSHPQLACPYLFS